MKVEKRIWFADDKDIAIVTVLDEVGPRIDRVLWARRVGLYLYDLQKRLKWLEQFGYVKRSGRVWYEAVRIPLPGEERVIGHYGRTTPSHLQ